MIVVIVHHWCKPDRREAARQRIDGNGDEMAKAPGFLYRYRIERPDEPLKVSTITAWQDEAAYRTFRGDRAPPDVAAAAIPYERVESAVFVVQHAHSDPRA